MDIDLNTNDVTNIDRPLILKGVRYHTARQCWGFEKTGSVVNVIGVVNSFKAPKKSQKGTKDWSVSFVLWDPSCTEAFFGLHMLIFSKELNELPAIESVGQIVAVQSISLQNFQGRVQALSKSYFRFAIFNMSANGLQPSTQDIPPARKLVCTKEELQYVETIHDAWLKSREAISVSRETTYLSARVPSPPTHFNPVPISEIHPPGYYKIICQVIRTWYTVKNFTAFVSDYSDNELIYELLPKEDGTHSKSKTIYGRKLLRVTLWDQNDMYCRKFVKEGDYLLLSNVKAKLDPRGNLECLIQGDRNIEKIHVQKLRPDDDLLLNLKRRRLEYFRAEKDIIKRSRAPEKKEPVGKRLSSTDVSSQKDKPASSNGIQMNTNVISQHTEIPRTTIAQVLHSPECVNITPKKFRLLARVVDFWPRKLCDFCVRRCPGEEYVWMFVLLMQDVSQATLPVIFYGDDAAALLNLSTLQPQNLRRNRKALTTMKERMFLLWGNLEEMIQEKDSLECRLKHLNNPWFELCVYEYTCEQTNEGNAKEFGNKRWRGFGLRIK
ncbi:telomere end-binding protein Pot1 [Schizosaccharomyces japonicus yFS275]|uniref:Protection of telomeres protein 1 n=1 Tax=Schizosaccharomyces japonicus (strain yFS275 / FY16936) TaxID=402676 RepID=B6K1T2_SCHJY|nr:telomere end-binding protein Pot1 [Schizosaccharomyces japonicus yFS275]EEB07113.1 telomere end-binding protein Pot1 [Schizosaccharomyces japonicus yFS275]